MSMNVETLCFDWYIAAGNAKKMPAKWEDACIKSPYVILKSDGLTYTARPIYHQNAELMGWLPIGGNITDIVPIESVYAYTTLQIPDVIHSKILKNQEDTETRA